MSKKCNIAWPIIIKNSMLNYSVSTTDILCLVKWCKIQPLLLYVFSLKLFLFSFIYIQYLFHLYSVWSYIYSASSYLYSVSSYLYSVTSCIYPVLYSVSSYFIWSSILYSVSHTLRENIVPQVIPCSRFKNNQIELRNVKYKNSKIQKIEYWIAIWIL